MEPEFWHDRWREGRIGFHREAVDPHLVRHWPGLGVAPDQRVLVPLCGKSRDLAWLAGQGHKVTGVEISPLAVQAFFDEWGREPQRARLGPWPLWRAGGVEILCADFFGLDADTLGRFPAWYDRAALIALPAGMRARYLTQLAGLLAPAATGLLITLEYPQAELDGPPFSVDEAELAALCAGRFSWMRLDAVDCLADAPRFRERGVTRMAEVVYRLDRR